MTKLLWSLVVLVGTVASAWHEPFPQNCGKWVIQREVPTSTFSCWGEKEAKSILGPEIEASLKKTVVIIVSRLLSK